MSLTAQDVRRLRICSQCGQLGVYKPYKSEIGVDLVVCTNSLRASGRVPDYQHPSCYESSGKDLLDLEKSETDAIRLCDVSTETMNRLMLRKS